MPEAALQILLWLIHSLIKGNLPKEWNTALTVTEKRISYTGIGQITIFNYTWNNVRQTYEIYLELS